MKKLIFIILPIIGLLLFSCSKDSAITSITEPAKQEDANIGGKRSDAVELTYDFTQTPGYESYTQYFNFLGINEDGVKQVTCDVELGTEETIVGIDFSAINAPQVQVDFYNGADLVTSAIYDVDGQRAWWKVALLGVACCIEAKIVIKNGSVSHFSAAFNCDCLTINIGAMAPSPVTGGSPIELDEITSMTFTPIGGDVSNVTEIIVD